MRKYKPRLWGGAAQGSPADAFLSVLEQELLSSKDAPCSGSNPMHTQLFIALHARGAAKAPADHGLECVGLEARVS